MDNDDADRLAGIAYLEHHRKTPDSLFLLRLINEKDAQLTRAEKVIEAAREWEKSLSYRGDIHETFNVCRKGITDLKNALAEYDRPSAPERDGRDTDG